MKRDWIGDTPTVRPFTVSADVGRAPRILDAGWSGDGGSVRVAYEDPAGRRSECCFDHRAGTGAPGRIFIGQRPDAAGARPATRLEEVRIVALLRDAVAALNPPEMRRHLLGKRYDTEVASNDYPAWLVLRELWRRGDIR